MGFFDIFRVGSIKNENEQLKAKLKELHADEYFQVKKKIDSMIAEIRDYDETLAKQRELISSLDTKLNKVNTQVNTQQNKLSRSKELYRSVE